MRPPLKRSRSTALLAVLMIAGLGSLGLAGKVPQKLLTPRSDAGEWAGTWYYLSVEYRAALWLRVVDGEPKLKLQTLHNATGETVRTDWTGASDYVHRGRLGEFRLAITEADENTIRGTWNSTFGTKTSKRIEAANLTLYRAVDGRQLVMVFDDFERRITGNREYTIPLNQVWTFRKGSRREVRWGELPLLMEPTRDHWSSRLGFVLAASGSAIGLGNLWKFPYITWDNQGGAFVLVYLVCIALIGLPIMMTEILIGRKTQKSAVGALKQAVGPAWGVVGGIGVLTGFVILGYYTVIAGWSIRNFAQCVRWSLGSFPTDADLGASFGAFLQNAPMQLLCSVLFMCATMAVIYGGIGKGIERVARVLMPVLLAILSVLLVSALSMRGAHEALHFIFAPDFSQLGWEGVLEALGHSFFTLSLGMGAMITYGSYLGRGESVVRASVTVVLLDTLIAMVATVIMFSVIFSEGMQQSINKSAVGMLFITLPKLFYESVPFGVVLAPLFYVLVAFAALTSTISLLEVVVAYFIDQRGMTRRGATTLCGMGTLVLTLLCSVSLGAWGPMSNFRGLAGKQGLLSNLDHIASNWLLPVGGLLLTIAAGWAMTREDAERELVDERTPGWFSFGIWRFSIRYLAPIAVFAILCFVIFAGKDFS